MESSFVALFRAVNTNTSRECLRDTGVIRFHGAPFYAYPTTLSPPPGSILVIKSLVVAIYPPVCPPLHPSSSPSNPPVGPYQSTWWPTKPPHPGPDSTNIRQKENQGRHHSPSLSPHEIARLPLVQLPLVLAFFFGGTTQPSQLTGRPVTPLRRRRDSRTQLSIRLISRYVWGRERERKKEREKERERERERERGSSALCSAGPSTRVNPSTLTSLEKSPSPFFSHQWCFNIPIRTAVSNWCSGLCSFSDQPNDTPNRLLWKL